MFTNCPYCGEQSHDLEEIFYAGANEQIVECWACHKEYRVACQWDPTLYSYPIKEKENHEP